MKILINNKFVDKNEAQINIFSDAVMYGYGIFETLRTYSPKKTLKLEDHIHRLINSAKKIDLQLKYNSEKIQQMVKKVMQESEFELQRIKILAIPEFLIIISSELKVDEIIYDGVSLKTAIHKRSLSEIKSTSYLDCIYYYNYAIKKGYYDALFIDIKHNIYECTRSNIFWKKNNIIFTRKNNVLPGITRNIILEISQIPFEYKDGNLSDLFEADEVFITNSIIGIVPVTKINETIISFNQPGKLTKQIMVKYKNIIENGVL